MRGRWISAGLALALAGAVPAAGRDLPVPAGKGWQHAATGLILPAALDGLPRTRLIDNTDGEFDVMASFAGPEDPVFATVYVFQPSLGPVPIWFERSEWQIEHRDVYGSAVPTSPEPVAFAPPGGGAPGSALRRSYAPTGGRFRSTALAVMPLRGWLVAVRMTSTVLAPPALDAAMSRLIAAMRWPAGVAPAAAAAPIPACPTPLAFGNAKIKKNGGTDALFSLLLAGVAHDPKAMKDAKPVALCRDPVETAQYAVLRPADAPNGGYTLAVGDAGRTIAVSPTLDAMTGKDASYAVSLHDVDGTTTAFPSFTALPAPDKVVALIRSGQSQGRTAAGSKSITINASTFGK